MKVYIKRIGVQKMNNPTLSLFLTELGLNDEESRIYISLTEKGPETTLELSRNTNINRTRLYRLLESLKKRGFIEEIVDENRRLAKAVGLHQLNLLVKQQEIRTKLLHDTFANLQSLFPSSLETSQPGTRVLFHRGVDGIKQMVWNTLQAKTELVGYTYRRLDEIVGVKFSKEWHEEWVYRKLKMRDIFSDDYLASRKKGMGIHYSPEHFASKYISSKILNVNHQVDIYNDVIAYYNWFEGEVFGIEIYNKKIAAMQKQLFEIVWKLAKKSPI